MFKRFIIIFLNLSSFIEATGPQLPQGRDTGPGFPLQPRHLWGLQSPQNPGEHR